MDGAAEVSSLLVKVVQPLLEDSLVAPFNTKILLPYNPAIVLFGIYLLKGVKHICPHKDLYTHVLEASIIMAET